MSTRRIVVHTLIVFGISIVLSSCAAFQPVDVGPFVSTENEDLSTEIIDPVCGQTIEFPQEELIWQFEGRNYYFYSSECMDKFKMAPEKYLSVQPHLHQTDANNNIVTWSLWGAAAGAMMLLMLL